jgi:hypothetical protein
MKQYVFTALLFATAGAGCLSSLAQAQFLDQDGVTLLWATTTNLNGSGIRVGHPEDPEDAQQAGAWEVDPALVGQSASRFTYTGSGGTTNVFPNALGTNSYHAVYAGQKFYGSPYGIATNVAQVDNFESPYFYDHYIANQVALNDAVVNQSYSFGGLLVADQQQVDTAFDNYAVMFKTLFVSAVDNGGGIHAPATSYNGIGVGAYNGFSSIGPTADNGRCKPDICAPDYVTSFATPQVAGVAVLLLQAALRGDGGSDTNPAADIRTLKALLLNGAIKPAGWTNSNSSPLDARYGAGLVNAFNSYRQLIGGPQGYVVSNLIASGSAHLPTATNGTISVLNGWDFNTNTSSSLVPTRDGVNHYYFNATNGPSPYICNATLVWNRQLNQTNINNLDLFLYDCANSNLVACSTSLVDNVEHIFAPNLPPGRYDLQVWKAGDPDAVSAEETYVLAFAFISPQLTVSSSESSLALQWPAYPDGLQIETSTDISAPESWNTDTLPDPTYTNGQHVIWLNATNTAQFFRLRQP